MSARRVTPSAVVAIATAFLGCGGVGSGPSTGTQATATAIADPPATQASAPSAAGSSVSAVTPTPIPSVVVLVGPKDLRACVRDTDCALSVEANCCGECAVFPFVALSASVVDARRMERTKHCPEEDWDCSKVACDPIPTGCRAVPACIRGLCEAEPVGACAGASKSP